VVVVRGPVSVSVNNLAVYIRYKEIGKGKEYITAFYPVVIRRLVNNVEKPRRGGGSVLIKSGNALDYSNTFKS
jgi:hypothetical protein